MNLESQDQEHLLTQFSWNWWWVMEPEPTAILLGTFCAPADIAEERRCWVPIYGSVGRFDEVRTAGKGFIGLAALISGNWNPIGAYMSSLLFGFADSLQVKLQILRVPIASEFLLMAPYIVIMIVMTGLIGRTTAPAADGQPYEK